MSQGPRAAVQQVPGCNLDLVVISRQNRLELDGLFAHLSTTVQQLSA